MSPMTAEYHGIHTLCLECNSYGRAFHSSAYNSDCALSFFVRQSLHEGETVELLPGESFAVHLGMFHIEMII